MSPFGKLLLCTFALLQGCSSWTAVRFNTSETYDLSRGEKARLFERARYYDADAALRLAYYFDFTKHDVPQCEYWMEQAAIFGDPGAKRYLPYLKKMQYERVKRARAKGLKPPQ